MADESRQVITRGALERVLARAAELQARSGEGNGALGDAGYAMTESQVEELGREVGLSAEHIRQALAEERARITPAEESSGVAEYLFGASRVAAQRRVAGRADQVLATLDKWMQKEEWLTIVRHRPERIVWEPRRGLLSSVRRTIGGRGYALYRADAIAATCIGIEGNATLVSLEASFRELRGSMAGRTAFGAVAGSAATGVAIVLGAMIPVAVVPAIGLSAAAYYSARRFQQRALEEGLLALERVLDRLERGETQPPSLLRLLESALPPVR